MQLSGSGELDGGNGESSTILPSNDSYRRTNGALRHSDDTEFNDALRARGILPPKASTSRSPSPDAARTRDQEQQDALEAADLDDDDALLGLEDDIPSSILEKYRAARIEEAKKLSNTTRFGSVLPIGREQYTREITEASKKDLVLTEDDDHFEDVKGKGTGVVCFLWKDSVPESQLLGKHLAKLAQAYPSTKFVSIRGDMCIANYPDKNIPTMLIYRKGELVKQIIGLRGDVGLKGMKTSILDIEALLTIYDAIDPFLKVAPTVEQRQQHGDSDEDEEDEDLARRQRTGIRVGGPGAHRGPSRYGRGENEDDEMDV